MTTYDTIIIGAGHNGLTAAAYLAKAGKKVLVLEKRPVAGGLCVTEQLGEAGPLADTVMPGGMLRPDIVRQLGLEQFALPPAPVKGAFTSLLPGSARLRLDPDPIKAAEAIQKFSARDAARWPEFLAFMEKACSFLDAAYRATMPRLPKPGLADGLPLAQMALKLRSLGRREMYDVIRLLPMTIQEFLEEWFEAEELKAALASLGVHGVTLGVMSAGTGFVFLHNYFNRGGLGVPPVQGGVGKLIFALEKAARAGGVEIRTQAEVKKIIVERESARGVELSSGEQLFAPAILSSADPKRTFLGLVGAPELPPHFVWNVQSIKMRGSVAKMHLVLGDPAGARLQPGETAVVAPSLRYIEKAYDAAKYGQVSEQPYLEISAPAENVLSIHAQFAPYALKNARWDAEERQKLQDSILNTLEMALPGASASLVSQQLLTPVGLEESYSLTEGDLNHGQLMLDQFLFMRPVPGWSNHKTPIEGLYLCGSGTHGGGGVNGIPGRNAAKIVLRDLK